VEFPQANKQFIFQSRNPKIFLVAEGSVPHSQGPACLPLVHVLTQMDPVCLSMPLLPTSLRAILILFSHYSKVFQVISFLQMLTPKHNMESMPHMPHALPISTSLIGLPE